MTEELELIRGSRYRVRSAGNEDEMITSEGTFQGFVSVGNTQGLVLELGPHHEDREGTTRVIPTHVILALDVLEEAEKEETEDDAQIHYS